jgi:hypothetical protein
VEPKHVALNVFLIINWICLTEKISAHCIYVEFYSKNKFEKLVHLVGFIIRIYHDARSPECQILYLTLFLVVVLFYVFLSCSRYCLFCDVICIVCVYMCIVLLPPGGYPTAVNKYIISYHNYTKIRVKYKLFRFGQ